jgi:hypothetical protein
MSTNEGNKSSNPVVEVAREKASDNVVTLRGGVRVKLNPVPASLLDAVTSRIKEPEIPVWVDDDGRERPNPLDPQYEKDVADANKQRGMAAIDALTLFGVDLIDGLPPDEEWLEKLQYMERMGLIDVLGDYDLEDPIMKELVYKKFVGVTNDVIERVTEISGISPEEVQAAEDSFQGN